MSALGLNDVKLVPHDATWGETYQREAIRLRTVPNAVDVAHIGSTSIPHIQAKPVVDIALAVSVPADHASVKQALEVLGYDDRGEYGLPGRQFFTLGDPPSVHLHVVHRDASHWLDWVDFRDYLLAHPAHAAAYEKEKLRLAATYAGDRAAYTKSKADFILRTLAIARGESKRP